MLVIPASLWLHCYTVACYSPTDWIWAMYYYPALSLYLCNMSPVSLPELEGKNNNNKNTNKKYMLGSFP